MLGAAAIAGCEEKPCIPLSPHQEEVIELSLSNRDFVRSAEIFQDDCVVKLSLVLGGFPVIDGHYAPNVSVRETFARTHAHRLGEVFVRMMKPLKAEASFEYWFVVYGSTKRNTLFRGHKFPGIDEIIWWPSSAP